MTSGERLTRVIELVEHGSQRAFAQKIGCIQSTVSRMCNSQMPVTAKRAQHICSIYPDVNLDYLLGKSDDTGIKDCATDLSAIIAMQKGEIESLRQQVIFLQQTITRLLESK